MHRGKKRRSSPRIAANAFDPFSGRSFWFITDVAGVLNGDIFDSPGVTGGDDPGALIDNTALTAIPEPTTAAALLTGPALPPPTLSRRR